MSKAKKWIQENKRYLAKVIIHSKDDYLDVLIPAEKYEGVKEEDLIGELERFTIIKDVFSCGEKGICLICNSLVKTLKTDDAVFENPKELEYY